MAILDSIVHISHVDIYSVYILVTCTEFRLHVMFDDNSIADVL